MGARAIEIDSDDQNAGDSNKQQERLAPHVAASDVLITTAAIPGKPSPLLVTTEMITAMKPGSVVVDLAAQRGGNCEITEPDKEIVQNGVTILGPTNLPSEYARHASQLFSCNLTAFLQYLAPEGNPVIDTEDEIIAEMLVTHKGDIVNSAVSTATEEACKLNMAGPSYI